MGKRVIGNKYTREFKTEAVRLFENSDKSVPAVAKELGDSQRDSQGSHLHF